VFIQSFIDQGLQFIQDNWPRFIIKAFSAVAIFWWLQTIAKLIVKKIRARVEENSLESTEYTRKLSDMIGSIVYVLLMIISVFIIFAFRWLDIALIMWGFSIAIWFAMEWTIKNLISGVFIMSNKKVKLWDFVEILWKFNIRGTIEEVNVRNTIVKMVDKRRVLIPNWELVETAIQTLKSETLLRWELLVKVPRYVQVSQVEQILISSVNINESILNKEFTTTMISGFDKQWINFKIFFYFSPQMWKSAFVLWSELKVILWKNFKKYWIKAPYANVVLDTV